MTESSSYLQVLLVSLGISCFFQFGGFLVAYALQTEKFYDILGGLNYITLAIVSLFICQVFQSDAEPWYQDGSKLACTIVFVLSRLWLLVFLAWRAGARSGDGRFDEIKESFCKFFVAWFLQLFWVMTISLPMLFVNASSISTDALSAGEWVAIVLFAGAVVLQAVADLQKSKWVSAGRQGGFCQVGVWKYSRHPNYFGEMLQWWSCWAFSFASGSGWADAWWWLGVVSPAFTQVVLMGVPATGLMQANGQSLKRYYDKHSQEYTAYREATSILVPMIGYKYIPLCLKRTLFLDFRCYEYVPMAADFQTKDDAQESR